MFGPRLTTVFASRWKALLWSAGILATAYCTVPAAEEPGDPRAAEEAARAEAALKAMLDQRQDAADAAHTNPHTNPWAKDAR